MLKRILFELIEFIKYLNNEIENPNITRQNNSRIQSHYYR